MHDLVGFGDPWVAFSADGEVYLVGLDDPSNALVWRSDDGGLTWSAPVRVPGPAGRSVPYDAPSIVVDQSATDRRGTVYVLGTAPTQDGDGRDIVPALLARSSDRGASFEAPVLVMPTNLVHQAGRPVVLRDGSIVYSMIDFSTWRPQRLLTKRRAWAVRTTDGGRTFLRPAFVAEVTDFWSNAALAADTASGSPYTGRLHAALVNLDRIDDDAVASVRHNLEFILDTPIGVVITQSDDQGDSWSPPRLVAGGMAEARQTAIAVNRQGVVAVAWQQRTAATDTCFEPFIAVSTDGGETFLAATRVADTPSCPPPDVPGNQYQGFDMAQRFPTGGDYFGLVARPDGTFQALWADSRTGVFHLWTAVIRMGGASSR